MFALLSIIYVIPVNFYQQFLIDSILCIIFLLYSYCINISLITISFVFQSVQLICLVLLVAVANNVVFSAPTTPNELPTDPDLYNQTVNNKYPLTEPILDFKYRIAIISDLDKNSKSKNETNTWLSYLKQGYLTYNPTENQVVIEWDSENSTKVFKSHLSMRGRGLELSELVTYNGQLITLDDKTGLVYVINGDVLIPWVILVEGDGRQKIG